MAHASDDHRPDPDKLLDRINQERGGQERGQKRGTLKIFFGACAGVGKTYSMLRDAAARHAEGVDVVIGLVETHGREETAKLVPGMPIMERRKNLHRGVGIDEFDLDAAIARAPTLILLDELAHTNAPGSRHPKRWQDVKELLGHGINVYTTLNVQHLESLNDVVARLTTIQVKETIPDSVFDEADDIVLVDIPTDELLQRLRDGKVYVAEIAQKRAAENFFKKRNLIALRELALRRTAERVDAQMGVEDAAKAGHEQHVTDRLMVCVGHDALSGRIIRHTKRWAIRLKVPWCAVYVETSRHYRLNKRAQEMVERNLRLAEKLGAQMYLLKGENAVEEILGCAYSHGVTRIVVGRQHRSRFRDVLFGSLAEKIIRQSKSVDVTVITDGKAEKGVRFAFAPVHFAQPSRFFYAALAMLFCTIIAYPLRETTEAVNLVMFYLVAIVAVAARFGTGAAIFATLLGIASFNLIFNEPGSALFMFRKHYHFTYGVMLATAVVIGSMAGRLRLQAAFFRKREQEIERLFALTKELSSTRGHLPMSAVASGYIGEVFSAIVTIWLPNAEGVLEVSAGGGEHVDLREKSAAVWAYENRQDAGIGTDTLPGVKGFYTPLIVEGDSVGVMGVIPGTAQEFDADERNLLEAFANLLASALQRATTALHAEERRIDVEGEKLRNVLLSSISHDLRTPLAAINGLTSSILLSGENLTKRAKDALRMIHEQTSRLSQVMTNLLDITSLESGRIKLKRQPYLIGEIIGSAILRVQKTLEDRRIEAKVEAGGLIEIDGLLIEQVFTNLLENAIRFTAPDGRVDIRVVQNQAELLIVFADNGKGLEPGTEHLIFEKFYKTRDKPSEGGGLGLAICRAIIAVHGGTIWAQNNDAGGATISILLPRPEPEGDSHATAWSGLTAE